MYPGEPERTVVTDETKSPDYSDQGPTFEWQLALCNIRLSGFLVRIRTVPKGNPLDWCSKSIHG